MVKIKLSDNRIKPRHKIDTTKEYEVESYSTYEKETVANYDYYTGLWSVSTTVPSHITKILNINSVRSISVNTVNKKGTITSISALLDSKQVGFRNKLNKKEEESN